MTQASFSIVRFPDHAQAITAQAGAAIRAWRDGQILDVPTEMAALATRVAMQTFFSRVLEPRALRQTVEDLAVLMGDDAMLRKAAYPRIINRLPTAANRRFRRASERTRHAINNVIAERRASNDDREDLLSAVLSIGESSCAPAAHGGQSLTHMEARDQILNFLVAGTEAVSRTLSWALSLLARHPDFERRLHAEVDSVLGGAPPALEHLPRLELTGRIITETLRLYPPAYAMPRSATRDTRLGNYLIPAGTRILICPYLIHRRSDLYDDPGSFDPDRWDPARQSKPPREGFIPFGGGARKCIGDRFSQVETALVLATIASRWRLELIDGSQGRATAASPALIPHGLRLRARLR